MKRKKLILRVLLASVFLVVLGVAGLLWIVSLPLTITSFALLQLSNAAADRCANLGRTA